MPLRNNSRQLSRHASRHYSKQSSLAVLSSKKNIFNVIAQQVRSAVGVTSLLFKYAREHKPSKLQQFVQWIYSEKKTFIFFLIHAFGTLIVWQHFLVNKHRDKTIGKNFRYFMNYFNKLCYC